MTVTNSSSNCTELVIAQDSIVEGREKLNVTACVDNGGVIDCLEGGNSTSVTIADDDGIWGMSYCTCTCYVSDL